MDKSKTWLKINEVMEYLGIAASTVYRLADLGKLPAGYKIGRSTRWCKEEIDEYVRTGQSAEYPEEGERNESGTSDERIRYEDAL